MTRRYPEYRDGHGSVIHQGDTVAVAGRGRSRYRFIDYVQPDTGRPYADLLGLRPARTYGKRYSVDPARLEPQGAGRREELECQRCGSTWTRRVKRGRKPLYCPECK